MSEEVPEISVEAPKKISTKKKTKTQKKKKDRIYYPNSQITISEVAKERFLRKNIEYNLLNQIFSYVWSENKSYSMLVKYYRGSDEKARIFY